MIKIKLDAEPGTNLLPREGYCEVDGRPAEYEIEGDEFFYYFLEGETLPILSREVHPDPSSPYVVLTCDKKPIRFGTPEPLPHAVEN
jgi:hypothetical protein